MVGQSGSFHWVPAGAPRCRCEEEESGSNKRKACDEATLSLNMHQTADRASRRHRIIMMITTGKVLQQTSGAAGGVTSCSSVRLMHMG